MKKDYLLGLSEEGFHKIAYTEWGAPNPALPPAICVHGLTRNGRDFDSLAEYLAHLKSRYKVGTAKHYPAVWTWEAFQKLGYDGEGAVAHLLVDARHDERREPGEAVLARVMSPHRVRDQEHAARPRDSRRGRPPPVLITGDGRRWRVRHATTRRRPT